MRGYREVIWPKMAAAKEMANYWINGKGTPPKLDREVLDIEPVAEKGTFAEIKDPVAWQREQRKDRPLPYRDTDAD